jgi:hypothetical protein
MTYSIQNYSGSRTYTVTDGFVDRADLDIDLVGKGTLGYGQSLNTNFLKILENFNGDVPPPKAVEGQLWWRHSQQQLYVYNAAGAFVSLNPTSVTAFDMGNIHIQDSSITNTFTNANVNILANGTGFVTTNKLGITGTTTTKVLYVAANGSVQSSGMTYNPTSDTLTVTSLNATNIAGTLTTAAQTAITSVGTLNNLAVTGTISATAGVLLATSSGNVGINTPTPTVKLQVTTAAQGIDGIVVQNGTQSLTLRPNSSSGASNPIVQTGDTALIYTTGIGTGNFVIAPWNNNLSGIRLDSSGNVGIGVSSPGNKLDIATGSGQYATAINIQPSTHATSRRAAINVGSWLLHQDTNGNGTKDFAIYDANVPAQRLLIDTTGGIILNGGAGGAQLTMRNGGDLVIYNATNTGAATLYCDTNLILSTNSSIVPGTNGTLDLGTTALRWNTIWGKASSAVYADLAENYESDQNYEPGTVVEFGGEFEITEAKANSTRVAGIVSTNPGYLMNAEAKGNFIIPIGLVGRVPCKVVGPVFKGDMMVSAGDGYAIASSAPNIGTVIGKALENLAGGIGVIEVVVGRC